MSSTGDREHGDCECYEASFARAVCHLKVLHPDGSFARPAYKCRMSVLDSQGTALRPIELETGQRVQVFARSASQALANAIAFLERQFGALTEHEHLCDDDDEFAPGRPFVVSRP
jgi:hypothetical protein